MQTLAELDRFRIFESIEMMCVIPDDELVESPKSEILDIVLDLFNGCLVIKVVKVGGEINTASLPCWYRYAALCAGSEAAAIVARGSQKFSGSRNKPALVVSDDSNSAALAIFDPEPFLADALLNDHLYH